MIEVEFLKPKLDGARFQGPAIPLDFLKDIAVFEEFVISVAKAEWIRENAGRKRTPSGFMSGVSVKLTQVEDGSAVPVLRLFITAAALLPGAISPQQAYLEKAKACIIEAVSAAEMGGDITAHLPPKTLAYFERFGRGLRDGESIGFPREDGTPPARLTPQTRRKLVLAAPGVEFATDDAVRRGRVVDTNDTDRTFTIRLAGGQEVKAPLLAEHRDVIIDAQKGAPGGVRVAVRGIGRFDRAEKLDGFEHVEDVIALELLDVPARLDELRLLKAGWLNGGGEPLDGPALDKLANAFITGYQNGLPLPYTFPTEGGGIQFEWRFDGSAPEIEVNLASLRGDWLSDDEAVIDLATTEGWTDLSQRVAALAGSSRTGELA